MTQSDPTAPTYLPLSRKRGDTHPLQFDLAALLGGAAKDISGWSFLLTVDPEPDPADATNNLFQLTGTITDAAAGEFEFPISDAQADQTPQVYHYDIQATDALGGKRTLAEGPFTFTQDITKT